MFDSMRGWAPGCLSEGEIPIEATVAAMDVVGVTTGMLCT